MARTRRVSLKEFTTLRVGGSAELWEVSTLAGLREATLEPYRVLGAGSNLLICDEGVKERVIRLSRDFNTLREFTGEREFWVGAATPLPGLVRRAQRAGLSGLEGLLGVPAVMGGALAMNAGTRYGELSDTLAEVELFHEGEVARLPAHALNLAYRHAELPEGAVILRAKLRLTPSTPAAVQAYMDRVDAARSQQPKNKSAGCAFKNPAGDSAGRIIDRAGLKGLRVGDAMIAHEHGNFVLNLGAATYADVSRLIELVQKRIEAPLELEWRRWAC